MRPHQKLEAWGQSIADLANQTSGDIRTYKHRGRGGAQFQKGVAYFISNAQGSASELETIDNCTSARLSQ